VKALQYFVSINPNNTFYLPISDIIIAAGWCTSAGLVVRKTGDYLFRLPSQEGMINILPLPKDYVAAYYELLDKVKFLKENPDMINFPDSWVDKLI
jgi:hypothetical protein